jgi:protein involved in polysaccharide export with SLBB domain
MKTYGHCGARGLGISTCVAGVLAVVLAAGPAPALGESTGSVTNGKALEVVQEAWNAADPEFAVGDRLSIRLFERYVPDDGTGAWASLIEFPEVSGEYVVQEDGTVFLPLLGELTFAGQTQPALREEVSRRFKRSHGGSVEFAVRIVERDPVYVAGAVTSPGVYRHVPGMTVLHALTLAGGLPGTGADVWRRFDLGRERERLLQTELMLARLDAKSAVLEAEAADRAPNPPASLVAMVGQDRSRALLQEALALRTLERQRAGAQDEAYTLVIDTLEAEFAVLKESLVEAENTMALRVERVEAVASLQSRGLANETTYNIARDALIEARKHWHDMRKAFAHVQRSLAEAQQERQRLMLDDHIERERERAALRAQIADYKVTRETISQMLLGAIDDAPFPTDGNVEIIVLRRGVEGVTRIQVDEHAALKPGDLIEIRVTPEKQALWHAGSG